jgi:hypothetical protein
VGKDTIGAQSSYENFREISYLSNSKVREAFK